LRFASTVSPWWLLLVLPVVLALGIGLYRRQSRGIAGGHRWGLTALRTTILLAVVVLAFRPSLVRRNIATYPGRLLVVLDDSASMGIPDPDLPDDEALTLARRVLDLPRARNAVLTELGGGARKIERDLSRFETYGRSADRTGDAFWEEAERVQAGVTASLDAMARQAEDLAESLPAAPGLPDVAGRCRDLPALIRPLFSGDEPPTDEAVAKIRAALGEWIAALNAAENGVLRAAIDGGDSQAIAAAADVRKVLRLSLAQAWLQRCRDLIAQQAEGVSVYVQPLSKPEPVPLHTLGEIAGPTAGETDLTGALLAQLEAEDPFPLAGILLLSDGRNLGSESLDAVTRAAALRSVPIHTAAIGDAAEPRDLAVRDLRVPPFWPAGKPVVARVLLKTALAKQEAVKVELLHADGQVVTNAMLQVDGALDRQARIVFTPGEQGLHRYVVRAPTVANEVVPDANNRRAFTLEARSEPIRVLFLEWKPRWQSRFVLNILWRLDYLDVNAIIGLAQPEGKIARGTGKGRWPEDADALALYHLVVLGDLPALTLTETEWRHLADYVENGGSLVLLGNGRTDPLPAFLTEQLLPTRPRSKPGVLPDDLDVLELTPAGRHHPVTRPLRGIVESVSGQSDAARVRPETIELLRTKAGHSLMTTRFVGKGKVFFVDTDRTWRRLNATALDAHGDLVASMVDWAVETRTPREGRPEAGALRYTTRDAVQIWCAADGGTNRVVELQKNGQILQSEARPMQAGAAWLAAVCEGVAAGQWTVRLRDGETASQTIDVLDNDRELLDLSCDRAWLQQLAADTGGESASLAEADRLLNHIKARSRTETRETHWRLWDARWMLATLIVLLTVEWVWRKAGGLA
jgi:hypothetical protein